MSASKKIVVVGMGFAGYHALKTISRRGMALDLTVIDQAETFSFLPLLPDVLSETLSADSVEVPIQSICDRFGARFVHKRVTSIHPTSHRLSLDGGETLSYDKALICCGTRSTFYGNRRLESQSFTLDHASDARRLRRLLQSSETTTFVICGGGYTGIEIATHLNRRFRRENAKTPKNVTIVEIGDQILGGLPDWMRRYTRDNLARLGINVLLDTSVKMARDHQITFKNGDVLHDATLIWAAGVVAPEWLRNLSCPYTKRNRLVVDPFLRADTDVYAAGDVVCSHSDSGQDECIRMGVQFAVKQGKVAAENILRELVGHPLHSYRQLDLGYIVPMANGRSCGQALGMNFRGTPATILHYLMTVYRSVGMNKLRVVGQLIGFRSNT